MSRGPAYLDFYFAASDGTYMLTKSSQMVGTQAERMLRAVSEWLERARLDMTEIQVTARFRIHDGELETFEALSEKLIAITRQEDSGTSRYDWFYNEDHDECVVRETYRDSDAVLEHIDHVGETLGQMLEIADLELEVYGSPSPELLEASESLPVKVYHFHSGI